jgi:hypothetical protein
METAELTIADQVAALLRADGYRLPSGNPIDRLTLLPENPRTGQSMLVAWDGYRLYARKVPHKSISPPDEWLLVWNLKQFDMPGWCDPIIDAIFREEIPVPAPRN